MPALPFIKTRLNVSWMPSAYPSQVNSLGEHLRVRRLGLLQREVAAKLGVVSPSLIGNWATPNPTC